MTLRPVFVDHTFEKGGAELALARLLRVDMDWDAALICPGTPDADVDMYGKLPAAITVERRGPLQEPRAVAASATGGRARMALTMFRALGSLLASPAVRRADVLVANTTRASVYVAAAGVILRKPVVVHVRDLITPEAIGGFATKLMRQFVLPRVSGVVANSRASLETVEPYLGGKAIAEVIPSPAGLRPHPPEDPSRPVQRIGLVARVDPWKGQQLLLSAFSQAFPDARIELHFFGAPAFGTDHHLFELKEQARAAGVSSRVKFLGHVDDVAEAIESLDVCVQCSTRPEPMGQNVLQYLAAGKAVIVANEGGPTEWVTDGVNGLIFRARDVASLEDALLKLVENDDLRASVAERAYQTPGLLEDSEVAHRLKTLFARVIEAQ